MFSGSEACKLQSIARACDRLGQARDMERDRLRYGNETGLGHGKELRETAISMETDDAHMLTEVFATGKALIADPADLARPDDKRGAGPFLETADLMSRDSRQTKVSVTCQRHPGIGAADGAMGHPEEYFILPRIGKGDIRDGGSAMDVQLQRFHCEEPAQRGKNGQIPSAS
jgi:hypothetical protein